MQVVSSEVTVKHTIELDAKETEYLRQLQEAAWDNRPDVARGILDDKENRALLLSFRCLIEG